MENNSEFQMKENFPVDSKIVEDNSKFLSEIQGNFPVDSKIVDFKAESIEKYSVTLRSKCQSKEEFQLWLDEHEKLSGITYRVLKTRPRAGKKVIFKATYRCQHNTYPRSHKVKMPSKKHTGCSAKLHVTIKSPVENREVRSKDVLRKEYPSIITVVHDHNHNINIAEAVKFKDPEKKIEQKFLDLFKNQHAPAKALEMHKRDLMEEFGEKYYKAAADRSICPDIQWVYRLYYSTFSGEFGTMEKGNFFDKLQNLIETSKTVKSKLKLIDDDFVIALCTPLMQRVHLIDKASHIVFIDSSGNMDRYNCRVFLLMTDSCVGGLPLAAFISSSETEKIITAGLELIKEILPPTAFGGEGLKGPKIFLTDDSIAQQNSLKNVFPQSSVWLCSFHVLQAVWRWLWSSQHNIIADDRRELYSKFKKILISDNLNLFHKHVMEFENDKLAKKYPEYVNYVKKLLTRAESWCVCFRPLSKGNHTNNLVESAMHVLKDKILCRTRAYNVQQLFYFLTESLSDYYSQKILDVISGRYPSHNYNKYVPNNKKLENLKIVDESQGMYTVKNIVADTQYAVNLNLGFCSCPLGSNGSPCKHQHFVAVESQKYCPNIIPITQSEKEKYHYIAVGDKNIEENWYEPLIKGNENSKSETKSVQTLLHPTPAIEIHNIESETYPLSNESFAWEDSENKINEICQVLKVNFKEDSKGISEAISAMHEKIKSMKTRSSIISAMHNFGKYHYRPINAVKKATTIPVQPSTISRRKTCIGARKAQQTGRPPKSSYTSEHGYGKRKRVTFVDLPVPSSKAPHSLQECITRNVALGK